MNIRQLAADLRDDAACWESVEREFQKLQHARAERQRLERMVDAARQAEVEAMTGAQLALHVIKNRQDGKSG